MNRARPLTLKQAEVMHLVSQGYETKEIARELEISPTTVDQRIEGARRKLGGGSRKEAARRYQALQNIPERHIYVPSHITDESETEAYPPSPQDDLRFQDAAFDERALWDRESVWHLPGIVPKDVGKAGRLLVIFALALLLMLVGDQALEFAEGLGGWVPR